MWPRGNSQHCFSPASHQTHTQRVLGKCTGQSRFNNPLPSFMSNNSGIAFCKSIQCVLKSTHSCTHRVAWCSQSCLPALCKIHCNTMSAPSIHRGGSGIYLRLTDTLILFNFTAQAACLLPLCSDSVTSISHYQPRYKRPAFSVPALAFHFMSYNALLCARLMNASG